MAPKVEEVRVTFVRTENEDEFGDVAEYYEHMIQTQDVDISHDDQMMHLFDEINMIVDNTPVIDNFSTEAHHIRNAAYYACLYDFPVALGHIIDLTSPSVIFNIPLMMEIVICSNIRSDCINVLVEHITEGDARLNEIIGEVIMNVQQYHVNKEHHGFYIRKLLSFVRGVLEDEPWFDMFYITAREINDIEAMNVIFENMELNGDIIRVV
jgi:hypothetical protein